MRRVSIIIPTHNGGNLLASCLDSIYRLSVADALNIIVVDNASADSTSQILARHKEVNVVRNERNVGFAHACNQGAHQATLCDILIFLNNDTYSSTNWLAHLLACFDRQDVSGAGAVLHYANGTVQHAGVHFDAHGIPHNMRVTSPPKGAAPYDVQAVTGACLAVRRDHFLSVDGFDTRYRNSFEDIDLCLKLRRSGGRVQLAPRARLTHLESQTPGRHDFDELNRQLFLSTWGDSVLPDVSRVRARAESHHYVASVIPLPDNNEACPGPPSNLPARWEWIDRPYNGKTAAPLRQRLERATGNYLVFLDCSTYSDVDWSGLAQASVAAHDFLIAQTADGHPSAILLSRALLEEVGLPSEIDCRAIIGRIPHVALTHPLAIDNSVGSWRACRAVFHHWGTSGKQR